MPASDALPEDGVLRLNGNVLLENDTFSQADINAGNVSFQAGASRGVQAFTFTLQDGGEDGALPLIGEVLAFNVSTSPVPSPPPSAAPSPVLPAPPPSPAPAPAPAPPPPPSPAGITITAGTPQPLMPSGSLSMSEIIRNEGIGVGAVTLVANTGSTNLVTALLPGGVTLEHNGSRQAMERNDAIDDLLASIASKTPGNGQQQASVATQWLSSHGEGALIDVRTLSFSSSLLPGSSISLTGNTNASSFEAFVIDLSGLPSGAGLLLNDIDVASIIGAGEITGGAGNNVVIGSLGGMIVYLAVTATTSCWVGRGPTCCTVAATPTWRSTRATALTTRSPSIMVC
ncbi:hypothetical protein [Vreelandella stevensii]|uniref:hypothetical protein n=1 Tax=Vreelandella stevensii TaxID=502821 RepID=UPI003749F469